MKEVPWRRVRNFVQFLHMSGFASQLWSVRHPDPIAAPFSPPLMEVESAASAGPVASRQKGNVLYNRDLCRIISTFIPNTEHSFDDDDDDDDDDDHDDDVVVENADNDADDDGDDADDNDGDVGGDDDDDDDDDDTDDDDEDIQW